MSIVINKISQCELTIIKTSRYLNFFGLIIIALPILIFVFFMLLEPQRMGGTFFSKIISLLVILFLLFYLSRVLYLLFVDNDLTITKNDSISVINGKTYLLSDISSLLIIEYFGFRSMPNGFNLFLKTRFGKRIPVAIRAGCEEKDEIKIVLKEFLNIAKVEEKKWWIL